MNMKTQIIFIFMFIMTTLSFVKIKQKHSALHSIVCFLIKFYIELIVRMFHDEIIMYHDKTKAATFWSVECVFGVLKVTIVFCINDVEWRKQIHLTKTDRLQQQTTSSRTCMHFVPFVFEFPSMWRILFPPINASLCFFFISVGYLQINFY